MVGGDIGKEVGALDGKDNGCTEGFRVGWDND